MITLVFATASTLLEYFAQKLTPSVFVGKSIAAPKYPKPSSKWCSLGVPFPASTVVLSTASPILSSDKYFEVAW